MDKSFDECLGYTADSMVANEEDWKAKKINKIKILVKGKRIRKDLNKEVKMTEEFEIFRKESSRSRCR